MNLSKILNGAQRDDQRRHFLRNGSPVYPDYMTLEDDNMLFLSTIVRIEHEGEWYAVHFIESTSSNEELKGLKRLMKKVYMFQVLGTIQPDMEDHFGRKLYPKDQQISEETRLSEALNLKRKSDV